MTRKLFKAEWFWGREVDLWLKKKLMGYSLNFPCGMSQIGDVRADIDPSVKPDVIADIRNPEAHFKVGQFDTLVCDPPFNYWAYDKAFQWFKDICKLATKRLIFRAPLIALTPLQRGWKREYYICLWPGKSLALNMFHVFTNPNHKLA